MDFLEEVLVGEPDEIGEARGNKFVGVDHLEFEFGSGCSVVVGEGDVVEGSALA